MLLINVLASLAAALVSTIVAQPLPEGLSATAPPQPMPQPEAWNPLVAENENGIMPELSAGSAAALPTARSVVVIGAGMAGMTAAAQLAKCATIALFFLITCECCQVFQKPVAVARSRPFCFKTSSNNTILFSFVM